MNWLGEWYQWLWFRVEFNLTPIDRRPFTFIMRDYIFTHCWQSWVMVLMWYVSMFVLMIWHPFIAGGLLVASSLVLSHVVWGSSWIEKEQEWPPYLGD